MGPIAEIFTADFDGDGRRDVAARVDQGFAIRYGTGGGNLSEPVVLGHHVVAVADLVGDPLPDLLVLLSGIWENTGGGNFRHAIRSPLITSRPVVADVTGDGRPEIAVRSGGNISVLAVGDGKLQVLSELAHFGFDRDLRAADFNGDGNLDLFALHRLQSQYRVFYGDGRGDFMMGPVTAMAENIVAYGAADLDGDGRADVLAAGAVDARLHVFFASGARTSAPAPAGLAYPIRTSDLDRDGDPDVIAATSLGSGLKIYRNDRGTLTPLPQELLVGGTVPPAVDDLDGDGNLDLVIDAFNALAILKGNGDGTFRVPARLDSLPRAAGNGIAADLDGDGLDELIYPAADAVVIARGNGIGGFVIETLPGSASSLLAASRGEIAVGDGAAGAVSVFMRAADGRWRVRRAIRGPMFVELALEDLTHDGRNDVAMVTKNEALHTLRIVDGASGRTLLDEALPAGHHQYTLAVHQNQLALTLGGTARWSRGDPPILEVDPNGSVTVYDFDTRGIVTRKDVIRNERLYDRTLAGDFNGDGYTDLLAWPLIVYGSGPRSFAPPRPTPFAVNGGFAAGDINRDGITDVVALSGRTFTWYRGSAEGLQRADEMRIPATQSAPLVARLRSDAPASILMFSHGYWTEVETRCETPPGRRRPVRH